MGLYLPWLQLIASQISQGNEEFPAGIAFTYRTHRYGFYRRADPSLFCSAATAWVLRGIAAAGVLDVREQTLYQDIRQSLESRFPHYRNRKNGLTYNFWETEAGIGFPNGLFFRHFRKFRIPDDLDDTALVYLAQGISTSQLTALQGKMAAHANLVKGQNRSSFGPLRLLPAWSTWFGEKMPIEFDACVLANALCLLFREEAPSDAHSRAALQILDFVVRQRTWKSAPFITSHNYPYPVWILYHLARLWSYLPDDEQIDLRWPQWLVPALELEWKSASKPLHKALLQTSLVRLGAEPGPRMPTPSIEAFMQTSRVPLFTAPMLATYTHVPGLDVLAASPISWLEYECKALEAAYWAEYARFCVEGR